MKLIKKLLGMLLIYSIVMVGTFAWMWRIESLENKDGIKNTSIVYNID